MGSVLCSTRFGHPDLGLAAVKEIRDYAVSAFLFSFPLGSSAGFAVFRSAMIPRCIWISTRREPGRNLRQQMRDPFFGGFRRDLFKKPSPI
jgi:hypothetical protein